MSTPYPGGVPQPNLAYGEGGATSYAPPPADHGYGNTAQPMTDEGHPDVEGTSVGQLIGDVTRDLSTLMRQELELAKAELRADANKASAEVKAQGSKAGKGAGMLAGAGVAGLMALMTLTALLVIIFDAFLELWLAALIVLVIWGVVAAVLALTGKKKLQEAAPPVPEQTTQTLKEDVQWAKHPTQSART